MNHGPRSYTGRRTGPFEFGVSASRRSRPKAEFKSKQMKVLIAAGGTGGHIYPGIAVAKEIMRRDEKSQVLFVGTSHGLETRIVPENGFQLSLINSAGLKNVGFVG